VPLAASVPEATRPPRRPPTKPPAPPQPRWLCSSGNLSPPRGCVCQAGARTRQKSGDVCTSHLSPTP